LNPEFMNLYDDETLAFINNNGGRNSYKYRWRKLWWLIIYLKQQSG
jgi:hypothetical protein